MTPADIPAIRSRLASLSAHGLRPPAEDVATLCDEVDRLTAELAARPPRRRAVTWRANYLGMVCLWSDAGASMGGYYAHGIGFRVLMVRDYDGWWFADEEKARDYIRAKLKAKGWEV